MTEPEITPIERFLGEEYDPQDPISNFLRYKAGNHTVTVPDGTVVREIDAYLLHDELATVCAEGFGASADTIFSVWNTLRRAIYLATGDDFEVHKATIDNVTYRGRLVGVTKMLEEHNAGHYGEITGNFAMLAARNDGLGAVIAQPKLPYDVTIGRYAGNSFNEARASNDRDYFDRSLTGIQNGAYAAFFSGEGVAPRFRLEMDDSGKPTARAWERHLAENHLEMFVNEEGSIKPLYDGESDRYGLPQALEQCYQWADNAWQLVMQRNKSIAM